MSSNAGDTPQDKVRNSEGISLNAFLAALATSMVIFGIQMIIFLLLRNKLARIFKPKTYLAPERERTEPPPRNPLALVKALWTFSDRDIINKCGLDAYFFLRYLRTLLVIFVPVACVVVPIIIPLNYSSGKSEDFLGEGDEGGGRSSVRGEGSGLDTLAWSNITRENINRQWAHLVIAICVIAWVCCVVYLELRVYVKVRQDYLTSAVHRLRASATTVLVNNIPQKWLSEEALRGLFDVLPGGIRNIWLNRDLSKLLDKIEERETIHKQLEAAETELIKTAKKNQLKQRKKDEKKANKSLTKEQLEKRRLREDADARRMAQAGQGISSGIHEEIPHDVSDVVDEMREDCERQDDQASAAATADTERHRNKGIGVGHLGDGLHKFGQGLRGGVGQLNQGVEDTVGTTHGFTRISSLAEEDQDRPSTARDRQRVRVAEDSNSRAGAGSSHRLQPGGHSRDVSVASQGSSQMSRAKYETTETGNTVRQISDLNNMYDNDKRRWYQFWRAPEGAFASPVPQKAEEGAEFPFNHGDPPKKTFGQKLLSIIGFGDKLPPVEYEAASYSGKGYAEEEDNGESEAAWRKYVKPKHRPTHRLPRWGFPNWLAWLTFGKKVDTIYWCRTELARLNLEIRTDQAHPERYPLMNSAFIQFNEQVSAHIACQSLVHHLPKQMAPRINEVSPRDVLWSNMAIKWWDEWARTAVVFVAIVAMIILWTIPVASTGALANINALTDIPWLRWIRDNDAVYRVAEFIAGVLPAAILALVLVVVPLILDLFADFKGAKTGAQKTEFVQRFFFVFLFVQVFLVVSISSFLASSVDDLWKELQRFSEISEIWDLLASNLPGAANYFFSYMLLQAMSASSGALLQLGTLAVWYILARMLDSTARSKWTRNTELNGIKWGHLFPVYTNFACISLIYSVIAPLICIFAIITFGLLWFAQKYCLVYVVRNKTDTGGVLYPRALSQTFTGLYVMELCMTGLFFTSQDENGEYVGTARGTIMLIMVPATALFQSLLNRTFSPLFRYLPITIEDEAAIRDRAFAKDQRRRFGLLDENEDENEEESGSGAKGFEDEKMPSNSFDGYGAFANDDDEIELRGMSDAKKRNAENASKKPTNFNPFNPVKDVTNLAKRGGKGLRNITLDKVEAPSAIRDAATYRKKQRQKDLEAQRAIGDALFGGVADEIEDLMPEERNALVMESFRHRALRARVPTVWIPRDDLGVSDDEIRLTRDYSENIHISNEGTALDSKLRVVYGRNPPDFSEVDLIEL